MVYYAKRTSVHYISMPNTGPEVSPIYKNIRTK